MRVLVTGGAGFIGSSFVRYIVNTTDWEVLVYDKLTYAGRLENLHDVIDRIGFMRGDIADEEQFGRVLTEFEPDVVVNFAAETHVDRSINEPAPFMRTNIIGVFTILEAIRKRIDQIVLLHVSTDEVYGDLWNTGKEATESDPLNPSSPYSASKASGDLLIKAYGRTYGLKYRIVRPCNNYGPYQHVEKLIPRTIIRILHGKPPVIYGDGSQIRDWLYVEDTARAIHVVLEKGVDGEIYNVCGGMASTVKDIVVNILESMGKPRDYLVYGKSRPGEDRRYAMKCDKIRNLGWAPHVTLKEGLKITVKWYIENRWWWRPLLDKRYVLADHPW
ncbi:dTDP-glucose 4,6-dehydratase [Aeropyrum pernix K1]|uniref:dTDP-glucose 4,6-dehydratase n=1 Tax=Aeropyrum pernix (strain ATCC 700893 / DSM 11879 / JCM 9820 / NBRC 100138 / K1) TaxID=272557 RepID=Q9YCT1_AERPE|nr:dTDP-glucose 4,6-dehydratase [Aeropyrum pernix]BAA80166.1 dTDP-glucose 4,6-dehydratase [Aeropyrum pernix K1]